MNKTRKIGITGMVLLVSAIVLISLTQCGSKKTPQLGKDPLRKVIAAMTLEEKAYFVVGAGMGITGPGGGGFGTGFGTGVPGTGGFPAGEGITAPGQGTGFPQTGAAGAGFPGGNQGTVQPGAGQQGAGAGFQPQQGGAPGAVAPQGTGTRGGFQQQGTQGTGAPQGTETPQGTGARGGFQQQGTQGTGAPQGTEAPQGTGTRGAFQQQGTQGTAPPQGTEAPQGTGTRGGFQQQGTQATGQQGTRQQGATGGFQPPQGTGQTGMQAPGGFTGQGMPGAATETTEANDSIPETVKAEAAGLVPGAAGSTYAIPRLGIPSIVLADGPAGLRISAERESSGDSTFYCTSFPVSTLIASTWDTELAYQVGQAMGNEVLEYGADILLAPALNIHRNPLNGRNFEYYSEDPLVSGKMAAAIVNGVESQGVGTSIKHFAANNAETNRMTLNTIVSERALREIYLEGFRIAVQESQPWTVMSSYNKINGAYTSESPDLLTTVLRDDWGFQGLVMTDWMGGSDAVAQMTAGNDLLMPGNMTQAQAIIAAVRAGTLDEKILDRNVERILKIILESPKFKGYVYSNKPDLTAHAQIARQVAAEGMVLLRNENTALPIEQGTRNIAAFGNTSYNIITGGTGSGDVNEAYSISLPEGLENAGYTVNEELQKQYDSYLAELRTSQPGARGLGGMFGRQRTIAEMPVDAVLAGKMAGMADIALITIGRNSGEGRDRANEEGDFLLSQAEYDLIKTVSNAFHAADKKVIVILNIGGVIETDSWRKLPDAILLAWQGGQETGNAIADVLSGKINPSGRLATTFPLKYEDNPSAATFPGQVIETEEAAATTAAPVAGFGFMGGGSDAEVVYDDGVYVGYRYYETFGILMAYEFGFGLSYTSFNYDNFNLSSRTFKDKITVSVDVTNTGTVAGKEVVQLYLAAPEMIIDKPEQELKGFAKTRLLQPGETQTVIFEITPRNLASFRSATSSWFAESGTYVVRVGSSSLDTRQDASFELAEEITVLEESKALVPVQGFLEITTR